MINDMKKLVVPGRWVQIFWEDIGHRDGIVVKVEPDNISVFDIGDRNVNKVSWSQVAKVGNYVDATKNGLRT